MRTPNGALIVGRDRTVARILAAAPGSVHLLVGTPGTGKTAVLALLAAAVRSGGGRVVELALSTGEEVRASRPGPAEVGLEVRHQFTPYSDVVLSVADQLPRRPARELRRLVRATRSELVRALTGAGHQQGIIALFSHVDISDSMKVGSPGADPATLMEFAREGLAGATADLLNRLGGAVRLVLVDDVDRGGRELGDWAYRLATRLHSAVVVLSRAPTPEMPPHQVHRLVNLTAADIDGYLRELLGSAMPAGLPRLVRELTGGNPQAVELAAAVARTHGAPAEALLRQRLATSDLAGRMVAFAELALAGIGVSQPARVLAALCVPRRFNRALLDALLDGDPVSAGQVMGHTGDALAFLERHDGWLPGVWHGVHRFVRGRVLDRLAVTDPDLAGRLHARAHDYYLDLGLLGADESGSPYTAWLVYERPQWQRVQGEWLYHLRRTGEDHAQAARLGLARVFFDAYYWWAAYVPLPFCDELLDDWEGACDSAEDLAWLAVLRRFHRAYPRGWDTAHVPAQQWAEVDAALREVLRKGRLSGPALATDADLRHLRAVVDGLLVDAAPHCGLPDEEVDRLYLDTMNLFAANGESWERAWTEFERADFWLPRGRPEYVAEAVASAEELARDVGDRELIAVVARLHADACWARGEYAAAFDGYGRAVLHAVVFHVDQNPDGHALDSDPSDYSVALHAEMVERLRRRLAEATAAGRGPVAAAGAERIRSLFTPLWSRIAARTRVGGEPDPTVPPPPGPRELNDPDSTYPTDLVAMARVLAAELEKPVTAPLPDHSARSREGEP